MTGHYFSQEEPDAPSAPQTITYSFGENSYSFTTDAGVFSVGKMDASTDALLRHIPPLSGSLLDMGCGYGCIGIVLGKEYKLDVTQVDINPRALRLTRENAAQNGLHTQVMEAGTFDDLDTFDDFDKFHGQLYGCDICQHCCPFNAHIPSPKQKISPKEILSMDAATFNARFGQSAMAWRGLAHLQHNCLATKK